MKFEFRGFDQEGNFKIGVIEAADKESAVSLLHNKNILVTYIKPFSVVKPLIILEKISNLDKALFCRALQHLLSGGISLDESLKTIVQQISKVSFRRIIEEVYENVLAGLPFSQALEKFPDVFEKSTVRLIRIGELSGNLEEVLGSLAIHYESQSRIRNKIITSMFYPAMVLIIFLVTMYVLFFNIIPKIGAIFEENNLELPTFTKYAFTVAKILSDYWLYLVAFFIFLVYFLWQYLKSDEGSLVLYNFLKNFPVFGSLLKEANILNIVESFTFLIKGGLPIAESLKIISESLTNPYYKNALEFIAEEVAKGKSIADTFNAFPDLFTPLVVQSIYAGEKAGNLYNALTAIKNYLYDNLESKLLNISELIQPILIIFLALGLVLLEFTLIIPIQQLSKLATFH